MGKCVWSIRENLKNMADITKCSGIGCPLKEKCYRFTAKADEYQAYFLEPPIKDGVCDMYWGARVHNQHLEQSIYKVKKNEK
jgi:hypothetical protein